MTSVYMYIANIQFITHFWLNCSVKTSCMFKKPLNSIFPVFVTTYTTGFVFRGDFLVCFLPVGGQYISWHRGQFISGLAVEARGYFTWFCFQVKVKIDNFVPNFLKILKKISSRVLQIHGLDCFEDCGGAAPIHKGMFWPQWHICHICPFRLFLPVMLLNLPTRMYCEQEYI